MKVTNLSSGSKGNCTLVVGDVTTLLVDVGIGIRLLETSLQQLKSSVANVNAVLITHEHSDHVSGLASLAKKNPDIHIFVYPSVWQQMVNSCGQLSSFANVHKFAYDSTFSVGEFNVVALENFHDSVSCASFILSQGERKLGICTDLGIITDYQVEMLSMCKVVYLECNHDKKMLANCAYPAFLKNRIGGTNGHLSNEQCASAALKMVQKNTKAIVLSHISENSNLPEVAYSCVINTLEEAGINKVHVLLSYPKKVGKTITIL